MLNFTVGPVMSDPDILKIAGNSAPYFRTPEFSEIMWENERLILEFLNAPAGSRCVFLTSSGTGAMESCVMNLLNMQDKVIVVNGGSFGERFVNLCRIHNRKYTEIKLPFGRQIQNEDLEPFDGQGYTALLVNMCETTSGVLYDMPLIAQFCKNNKMILIIDAISAFIADELDMSGLGAAAVITGSQKALAVPPGVSIVALAPAAIELVENNRERCMYLSLKEALKNGERGQTPFTPAVTTLLQIHSRLIKMRDSGGVREARATVCRVAKDFRNRIHDLPFRIVAESMSNAVTALYSEGNAKDIVKIMKDDYGIWICPNGGPWAESVFRVGHLGHIMPEDNHALINAFQSMKERGLL